MISKNINGQLVDFYEDDDFNEDYTDYAYNDSNVNSNNIDSKKDMNSKEQLAKFVTDIKDFLNDIIDQGMTDDNSN